MDQSLELHASVVAHPLSGRKLYSPAALAAYTAVVNLPMGFILYGMNLKARGRRRLGISMVWFGSVCLVFITLLSLSGAIPGFPFVIIGIFGAINVYQLEKRPFEQALREGAVRARWWPPAVILLLTGGFLAVWEWLA